VPFYSFECDCGETVELYRNKMESPDNPQCPYCDSTMCRVYGAGVYTFKPLRTDQITGEMVDITTRRQRDHLLSEHKLTMDSGRYVRKPKYRSPVRDVTLGDVKREYERNRGEFAKEVEGPPSIQGNPNCR
jgi:hypothetical protein